MKQILIGILTFSFLKLSAQSDLLHQVSPNKHLSFKCKTSLCENGHENWRGKELETIGMPCGGIGAGQLYVRGDGTLACWWICNNAYNTGYGVDSLTHFNTALG